jgi:hypothetical protein
MREEAAAMQRNGTYTRVSRRTVAARPITGRWVYKTKFKVGRRPHRVLQGLVHRARLPADQRA